MSQIESLVLPRDLGAERATLGAMLLDARAVDIAVEMLSEASFYQPSHQAIFAAISDMRHSRVEVDLVTVRNKLGSKLGDVGGVDYLVQLAESTPSPASCAQYAEIVRTMASQRKMVEIGRNLIDMGSNLSGDVTEKVAEAERQVMSISADRGTTTTQQIPVHVHDFIAELELLADSGKPKFGIPSKFFDLDKVTGGFYDGDLIIVGARPSMGKTAFTLGLAVNAAKAGHPVLMFSIEMSAQQLVRRMISMLSGVSMQILKRGDVAPEDYEKLTDAAEIVRTLPIRIDDASTLTPAQMMSRARRAKADHGIKMICVDYLQLMQSNKRIENRNQEVGEIVRHVKSIARELDVPIVALCQLNRGLESRQQKRPQLSDLRESGSIEAEADLAMLLYREAYYSNGTKDVLDHNEVHEAEIIIAKHRNGPTGTVKLGFQPNYARFVNLRR